MRHNYNFLDLTGKIFGRLTVLKMAGKDKSGAVMWLCRCECGVEKVVLRGNLTKEHGTKSCGCLMIQHRKDRMLNLMGRIYGRWTVIGYAGRDKRSYHLWLCHCSCGTERIVNTQSLQNGHSQSCGCLKEEHRKLYVGEKASGWKGGLPYRDKNSGYVRVYKPNHPNAKKDKRVLEHVFIMSHIIGRPLIKGETVHHKNGIRHDNEPNNLEFRISAHGAGQRIIDLVPYWRKMLKLYEPIFNKL
jgi:hypothetical protein